MCAAVSFTTFVSLTLYKNTTRNKRIRKCRIGSSNQANITLTVSTDFVLQPAIEVNCKRPTVLSDLAIYSTSRNCDKSGTMLSPCYKVDDGNRLATSCSNMTDTNCSQQVATSLLSSTCNVPTISDLLRL